MQKQYGSESAPCAKKNKTGMRSKVSEHVLLSTSDENEWKSGEDGLHSRQAGCLTAELRRARNGMEHFHRVSLMPEIWSRL